MLGWGNPLPLENPASLRPEESVNPIAAGPPLEDRTGFEHRRLRNRHHSIALDPQRSRDHNCSAAPGTGESAGEPDGDRRNSAAAGGSAGLPPIAIKLALRARWSAIRSG